MSLYHQPDPDWTKLGDQIDDPEFEDDGYDDGDDERWDD